MDKTEKVDAPAPEQYGFVWTLGIITPKSTGLSSFPL